MCGRYAASADLDQLVEEFEIDDVAETLPGPSWNIAPTDPVTAVVARVARDGAHQGEVRRRLVELKWGLVPSWSKAPTGGARMINARLETVAEKPSFRKAFVTRRCLLPADGYFEWYASSRLDAKGKPVKQPFFIHRGDGGPLVMAGLFEFWRNDKIPGGEPGAWLSTCTIITTPATDALGHIHDRMPMVIGRSAWEEWLDPGMNDPERALELLKVTEAENLDAYAVGRGVGNVRNNGPELVDPIPLAEDGL